jgi:hypothetical protein
MTANNQNKSITNVHLLTRHGYAKHYMTSSRLQELAKEKQDTILVGSFTEDLTDSAIALAQSFPEYQEDTPLFEHHWGYINSITTKQLTEIVIPDLRVRINNLLRDFQAQDQSRLIEIAKAYELCNTRLLALMASK